MSFAQLKFSRSTQSFVQPTIGRYVSSASTEQSSESSSVKNLVSNTKVVGREEGMYSELPDFIEIRQSEETGRGIWTQSPIRAGMRKIRCYRPRFDVNREVYVQEVQFLSPSHTLQRHPLRNWHLTARTVLNKLAWMDCVGVRSVVLHTTVTSYDRGFIIFLTGVHQIDVLELSNKRLGHPQARMRILTKLVESRSFEWLSSSFWCYSMFESNALENAKTRTLCSTGVLSHVTFVYYIHDRIRLAQTREIASMQSRRSWFFPVENIWSSS